MLLKLINNLFNMFRKTKISIKITIVYAFMFSLVLLILNASILYGIKYYLYGQANKQITDVKTLILSGILNDNKKLILSDKELFSDIPFRQNISAKIVDRHGKILIESNKLEYNLALNTAKDKTIFIKKSEKHLAYRNIIINTKNYGKVFLQIVKNMDNEHDFLKVLFADMAIADFIGIIASIIVGYIVSKKMLKPIDCISKTAENISINNLRERIEVNGNDDELERLGNTFNKMINRLQEAFDRQTQFVSDASHELKTPIAIIQGYASLLDRWGKDDREALEKSVSAIKSEAAGMAELVENLLFIAKGDNGIQRLDKEKFPLNMLIDEVVRESRLIESNHIISNSKNAKINVFADYKMLKQMLRIFMDNSIKFSPVHTTIDISSEVFNNKIKITVSDNGNGIPKDEIEKIFDRFYTVDKSRAKDKGGTGLGLSIAKWIVDMHNGNISVESLEGEYTQIIVILNCI